MAGDSDSKWESVSLGDIASFVNGDRGKNYPSQSDYVEQGIPFISATDLVNGRVNVKRSTKITEEAFDRLGGGKIIEGDLLFCLRGSLGRIARVRGIARGAIASSLVILRARSVADRDYIYYVLSGSIGQRLCEVLNNGSAQPNISAKSLQHSLIPLPPLPTQRAIASVLGTLDDLIELNRETNEILEEMARALFKSWFVDFDPVRAKLEGRPPAGMDAETAALFPDHFEDSELGQIPRGWKVGCISDIATIENQSVSPGSDPERVWEHYSIPAFDAGVWPASDKGSEIKSGKYRIPDRAVLLSKLNPDTPRVWLPDLDVPESAVCSTEFLPFVPREAGHRSFLFELLRSEPVFLEVCNRATGSTGSRQRVKPADVERIQTVIPLPEIIEAFVVLAGPLHDLIASNRRESRDLAALRDTLLPNLLSGEVEAPFANP